MLIYALFDTASIDQIIPGNFCSPFWSRMYPANYLPVDTPYNM